MQALGDVRSPIHAPRRPIGVGVIGASPRNPGWAVAAHLPALRALREFELRAVSTSRADSAAEASRAFGVPGYDNADALVRDPAVDLIVVAVKVPHHRELILRALRSGKMVFSEWPLGVSLAEAEELAAAAREAHVRTAIGLQARYAPAISTAAALVAGRALGDVLGSTLVGSGMAWGAETDRAHAYLFDAESGATLTSVAMMHALDAAAVVLGELASVTATSSIGRRAIRLTDADGSIANTAPDHVAVTGTLRDGGVLSVFYRGGTSRAGNLRWEIHGTEGELLITADNGNLQVADLVLSGAFGSARELVRSDARSTPLDVAANVKRIYAALARDVFEGTSLVPSFEHAVRRHRLLAAIDRARVTGARQELAEATSNA